jgi:RHS repeat-associated protein
MKVRSPAWLRLGCVLALGFAGAPAWSQSCPVTGGNPGCRDTGANRSTSATSTAAGNPIDVTTGNKYQAETDLAYPGDLPIGFSRHYNSAAKGGAALGPGWTHEFETVLSREQRGKAALIRIQQADGRVLEFREQGPSDGTPTIYRSSVGFGVIEEDAAVLERLRRIVGKRATAHDGADPAVVRPWIWRWPDGRRLAFDGSGRLRQLAERNGARLDLEHDRAGRLAALRDDAGRSLAFHYWDDTTALLASYGGKRPDLEGFRGRLKSIFVPEGGAVAFGYDSRGLLTAVRHPDGRLRQYQYADVAGAARLVRILSGGEIVGEYAYDSRGRANYSAGDGESVRLDFGTTAPQAFAGETRVTNTQGSSTIYRWKLLAATGQRQIVEARGPGCAVCPPGDRRYSFDSRGQIIAVESPTARGARIETTRYDSRGRLVARVVKIGSEAPRLIESLEYASADPEAQPSAVQRASVVPGLVHRTAFEYDADGRLVRAEESGFAPALAASAGHERADSAPIRRETTLRHVRKGERIVLAEVDGPLPGDADVVRFDWDDRGIELVRVRHPHGLQHTWKFEPVTGRLESETPADGVTIGYRFDSGGLLSSRTRAGAVVALRHDSRGRADRVELPDGEILRVAYGGPGTSIAMISNRGVARWLRPPALQKAGAETYAATVEIGSRHLAQLRDEFEAGRGWGRTDLSVDDFGRVLAVNTGATGEERYRYDAADRLVERRFADGTVWVYRRDALGRVVLHRSTDGASQRETRLSYDGATLVSLAAEGESVTNARDANGRIAARTVTRTLPDGEKLRYTERFRYDTSDRLIEHRLPEGGRLEYAWGVGDALTSITYWNELGAATKLLVGDSKRGFSFGNGVTYTGTLGKDGRLEGFEYRAPPLTTTASRGSWSWFPEARAGDALRVLFSARLEFDRHGKLLSRTGDGERTSFAYDDLGRLLIAAGGTEGRNQFFAYNRGGDLLARSVDGNTRKFDAGAIEREAGGLPTRVPSMMGMRELRYTPDRRLAEVRAGDRLIARYSHNAFGERIAKTVFGAGGESATMSFLYLNNRLAGESSLDDPRRIARRYVYARDVPVAVLDYDEPRTLDRQPAADEGEPGAFAWIGARLRGAWTSTFGDETRITYLHANEIGTPIGATDAAARVVWSPEYLVYGAIRGQRREVEQGGLPFTLNLRLPGQYYDVETGWHDNYLRTYDPARGQYLEPDPLGPLPNLRAGREITQPFAYVNHDPLLNADPLGLVLFPFDGTANHLNDRTNVFHFADYYASFNDYDRAAGINGRTFYVNGVGTEGGFGDNGVTGGAFSRALRERVDRGLGFLDQYLDGYVGWEENRRRQAGLPPLLGGSPLVIDIDTVGFSRGAATAREWVNRVLDRVEEGYYERRFGGCVSLNLRMMALFETVLGRNTDTWFGNPFRTVIPDEVDYVAHAVAMNEHRGEFPVELINPSQASLGGSGDFRANRVERGFVGAHSDIGGGYNGDASSGEGYDGGDLSDVALNWMFQQAAAAGVTMRALPPDLREVTSPIVHDPRRSFLWSTIDDRNDTRHARFRGTGNRQSTSMAWTRMPELELRYGMTTAAAERFYDRRALTWGGTDTRIGDVRMCEYLRWITSQYGNFMPLPAGCP